MYFARQKIIFTVLILALMSMVFLQKNLLKYLDITRICLVWAVYTITSIVIYMRMPRIIRYAILTRMEEMKKMLLQEKYGTDTGLGKRRAAEWKLYSEGIYEENPYN